MPTVPGGGSPHTQQSAGFSPTHGDGVGEGELVGLGLGSGVGVGVGSLREQVPGRGSSHVHL
jgi:hypothetical protein